ncbi:MAG TPA: CDP-alcohol phosphatidyltransferase family protein [Acidimicrobiia bacterium]|nr:CDP-alcohol phosphatidyltransferase family protein [Acidimicrobiia bacterium]
MAGRRIVTIPNLISVLRLACAPLLAWLLLGPDDQTAAFVILAVLGATDWVDGWIARHYDQGSELGKILDPTADRILLLTAGVSLVIEGSLPVAVAVAVLAREVLVAGATLALAAAGARRIDVKWAGKAGTLALMFALPGFLLVHIVDPGAGRTVILSLTWLATIGGLILSYWAAAAYVPAARAALREGRRARAQQVAA